MTPEHGSIKGRLKWLQSASFSRVTAGSYAAVKLSKQEKNEAKECAVNLATRLAARSPSDMPDSNRPQESNTPLVRHDIPDRDGSVCCLQSPRCQLQFEDFNGLMRHVVEIFIALKKGSRFCPLWPPAFGAPKRRNNLLREFAPIYAYVLRSRNSLRLLRRRETGACSGLRAHRLISRLSKLYEVFNRSTDHALPEQPASRETSQPRDWLTVRATAAGVSAVSQDGVRQDRRCLACRV